MSRIGAILSAALLLAVGMVGLGIATARALRERDRAVRDGVLLAVAQDLESELRQFGPADVEQRLAHFVAIHSDAVAGIEVLATSGLIARTGLLADEPTATAAALGPQWRGFGGSAESMRRGRGSPPFTLRLYPSEALGHHGRMATAVIAVSAMTAAALFGLALLASRGLVDRERRLVAEAEQKRLHVAALAGAGLAHRIRTPLATIKGTAQLLESASPSATRAHRIVEEAGRIDAMIRQLLDFARPPDPQAERFDVAAAARAVADRFQPVTVSPNGALFAMADPTHFEMALDELMTNARAFDAGPIEVTIGRASRHIAIEVRDHGPGLAVEAKEALEPYVTTRVDGTGLGLSIAQALIRSNGGELEIGNAVGGGCSATIRLPEAS